MENKKNLKKFIVEIAEAEKIELKCVILATETKVNGFFGDIFRANIRGKRRSFNVFIKVVTKSDKIRAIAPVDEAYNNESMFYKDIFPAMKKLEAELKLLTFFDPVPRFYRDAEYGDQCFLAMEDLTRRDFRMFDLKEEIDEDHLMMISRLFGKFHALSFALKHLRPEIYKDLVNRLQCVQSGFLRYKGGFFKHCVCVIKEGLKKINSKNKIINYYVKNIERSYKNILVQSKKDKYTCIVHYDAWMNNMMFKYSESRGQKTLIDIKLIDWQTCNVGSPVIDLSLVFYGIASKRVFERLNLYLRVYYNAFEDFLSQTGLKSEDVYPFEVLYDQWKTYSEYGLIQGLIVHKIRMNYENTSKNFEDTMNADFNAAGMLEVLNNLSKNLKYMEVSLK